ncbi:DUF397 domain-containing protein [Actinomadura monticuli]|uniref:DUF397 domain-containing protein n=1 Tax=Actinomadura monticuli TaxID=3097367 RepID=A0ABV4Q520_9ACTN
MSIHQIEGLPWRKSSYSTTDGTNCVEVAAQGKTADVLARDSKNPSGPVLAFAQSEWCVFLTEAKRGAFDL